jgi:hypothetical protein
VREFLGLELGIDQTDSTEHVAKTRVAASSTVTVTAISAIP